MKTKLNFLITNLNGSTQYSIRVITWNNVGRTPGNSVNITTDEEGKYMRHCTIWYHLCNLKNMKNTHRGVLILSKVAG